MWFCWLYWTMTSSLPYSRLYMSVKETWWELAPASLRPWSSARKGWSVHYGSGINCCPKWIFTYIYIWVRDEGSGILVQNMLHVWGTFFISKELHHYNTVHYIVNLQDRNKVSIPSQWSIYQSALLYCSRLCFLPVTVKEELIVKLAGWSTFPPSPMAVSCG